MIGFLIVVLVVLLGVIVFQACIIADLDEAYTISRQNYSELWVENDELHTKLRKAKSALGD